MLCLLSYNIAAPRLNFCFGEVCPRALTRGYRQHRVSDPPDYIFTPPLRGEIAAQYYGCSCRGASQERPAGQKCNFHPVVARRSLSTAGEFRRCDVFSLNFFACERKCL